MADNDETTSNDTPDEASKADDGLINLGKADVSEPAEDAARSDSADAVTVVAESPANPTPKSGSTPVGLLAAVGVLALLLIGLFVSWNPWFGPFNGSREVADIDEAKESAASSGCEIANKLFTYDFNKIDEFFDAVQESSTGRFGDGFVADKEQLRTLFVQSQVVSRAEETSCETEMIGDDRARVRMQGTQIVMSSIVAQGQEQTEHVDLYLDLEKSDGEWKVFDLSPANPDSLGTGMPGTQPAPGLEPTPGLEPGTEPGTEEQPAPEEQPETPN